IERREAVEIPGVDQALWVTSPPDLILRKLWWFRLGGEVSDRQWRDVVSVIRVQGPELDLVALLSDATSVGLDDLARRAIEDSERHRRL
ncbi:MAG: hypothetical protein ACK5O2_07255, partial [Microthrixaceae bacterium]